jgi:hypothetical protein
MDFTDCSVWASPTPMAMKHTANIEQTRITCNKTTFKNQKPLPDTRLVEVDTARGVSAGRHALNVCCVKGSSVLASAIAVGIEAIVATVELIASVTGSARTGQQLDTIGSRE